MPATTQLHSAADLAFSTLDGAITNSATSFDVQTGEGARFPSGVHYVTIVDSYDADGRPEVYEHIEITSRSSDAFTVANRGVLGTTAVAHDDGADVLLNILAGHLSELQNAIAALQGYLVDDAGLPLGTDDDIKLQFLASGNVFRVLRTSGSLTIIRADATGTLIYDELGSERFSVKSGDTISNARLRPNASDSRDLGTPAFAWRDGHFKRNLLLGGAAAAVGVIRAGTSFTEGLTLRVLEETVVIGSAAASHDLTADLPAGAIVLGGQLNITAAVTATTAVKVGLGPSGDPDKYGLTGALTKNSKGKALVTPAVLGSAEDVQINACDTGGAAAGTLDSGTVRVRLYYWALDDLDSAA